MKISQTFFGLILIIALLTGCASDGTATGSPPQSTPAPATTIPVTGATATEAGPSSTGEAGTSPSALTAISEEPVRTEEQAVLSSFSGPVTAGGERLLLYGHLLDASGAPLSGYAVEIWQVDENGIYDHPGDANTASRDAGFQSYGTSLTDENGLFAFRTIVPARYEPRPRHIHFKVKKDGAEVLTSQFYFSGDVDAARLGANGDMLLLELREAQAADGNAVKLAFKDIIVNTGSGGSMPLTPSQTEGPYYPVVDVSTFDNDLASVR